MEKLPRQVYTTEFRQQAVELITRDGLSIVASHVEVQAQHGQGDASAWPN
jgi:transposase-like protein